MSIDDGGNAFPSMLPGGNYCMPGMSLRAWYAGQAMQQLIAFGVNLTDGDLGKEATIKEIVASQAFAIADAMIMELNKENKNDN
jgi:hypothetical protein